MRKRQAEERQEHPRRNAAKAGKPRRDQELNREDFDNNGDQVEQERAAPERKSLGDERSQPRNEMQVAVVGLEEGANASGVIGVGVPEFSVLGPKLWIRDRIGPA